MEMEPGKLFIGGISWDTNEDRLREYFQAFGEVVEAVIMKDRTTGRARGFGFVIFADPAVAETVILEKHVIDGRTVEAKKAVPRDDQQMLNKNSISIHGSPGLARTKKIFVGGLASTVTEGDFKHYFDQFGTITDVVVMYDHNTQRPRGFGFITYDSEEAVDRVLLRTFHELNGKMVEVKRAVPKESSPGPNRSPLGGYSYGLSRVSNFLNAYAQGYNQSPIGGRFSSVAIGRSGYPTLNPSGYGVGPNSGGSGNFNSNLGYGHGLNPVYNASPNRYGMGNGGNSLFLNSTNQNMWGSGNINYATNLANSSDFMGSGSGSNGLVGAFGNIGALRGTFSRGNNISYGSGENSFGSIGGGFGRNNAGPTPSFAATNDGHDGNFGNVYGGGSCYGDATWRSSSPELEGSVPFGYGLGNAASDAMPRNPVGYVGYSVANRSNRGIAA